LVKSPGASEAPANGAMPLAEKRLPGEIDGDADGVVRR
jgi:hypothetical protein